jgi:hypothetical protein
MRGICYLYYQKADMISIEDNEGLVKEEGFDE